MQKLLNVGYGLGLFVTQEDGITTIGHGGAINGYTTALETIPSQKFGIVILANKSGFDPTPILYQVRLITYDYRIIAKIPKASFPLQDVPPARVRSK